MQNNLLFRFSNWQHHVKSSIREDFEILNKMRRNSFSHKAYIPHEEVICAMRAEFWLNFFMHGSNTSYSYVLMRNTFVHVTEARSIEGGMMLLHPARMNGDERDNHFHLYSSIVPAAYITAVRHIYNVARVLHTDDACEYMIVCFASWAYQPFFAHECDSIDFAIREYRATRASFSVKASLRVVNDWRGRHPGTRVDIVNAV